MSHQELSEAELRAERLVQLALDGEGWIELPMLDFEDVLEARRDMSMLMLRLALRVVPGRQA